MTALSLSRVVSEALAEIGAAPSLPRPHGPARVTTWFAGEHGFGMRTYAGNRSVYIVQTRMAGRVRTVTIGPASVLSQHQAGVIARRVLAHALVGDDPATDRLRIRAAPSFKDFLVEYWTRWTPRWKPSTLASTTFYRRLYLDDAFPGIFIDALTEADATRWFADLNNRLEPGSANRVMAILAHMMTKAEDWGYRVENTNPCRVLRRNRARKRERFLSKDELARVGAVLATDRAAESEVRVAQATVITLLILTGCRLSEIINLQWQDVHRNRLLLRDSKVGPRTVWLGDEARTVIAGIPRRRGIPWLFWNPSLDQRILSPNRIWYDVRTRTGIEGVRLHDLRHTFASHAAMSKETLPMIGRLLGHANPQSTTRYAHFDDGHLVDAAEAIGATIAGMMAGDR